MHKNVNVSFTGIDYGDELGIYIDSINGVHEDIPNQVSWVFLKWSWFSGFCVLPVGMVYSIVSKKY